MKERAGGWGGGGGRDKNKGRKKDKTDKYKDNDITTKSIRLIERYVPADRQGHD
jgi:hypothetical protein